MRSIYRLIAITLVPFKVLAILSDAKSFAHPIIGSAILNQKGLHIWRLKAAHKLAEWRRSRLTHLISLQDINSFQRDGFVQKNNFLPDEKFEQLQNEIKALPEISREMVEGNTITRRIAITPEVLKVSPAIRYLVEHETFQGLSRYIASKVSEPFIYVQTILQHSKSSKHDPQFDLHMDTFHPTMKAWFFLEDVCSEDGPFSYVPGSHQITPRRLVFHRTMSLKASRLKSGGAFRVPKTHLSLFHLPEPHLFSVKKNTLVVADTFGIHARTESTRSNMRIEIYASSRPFPFAPNTINLFDLLFPKLRLRKPSMDWKMQDLMQKLGLKKLKWRKVLKGPKTID